MTLVALSYNPPTTTNKWKKGLAILTKYKIMNNSKTTKAAATEKILRHEKKIVKCEDLTAKEFAQLAGIKIKVDCTDIPEEYTTTYLTTKSINNNHQMTSISTALSTKSCHQIWDSDFWQCTASGNCSSDNKQVENDDTLFIKNLRTNTSSASIQKGRFKIIVGQDDGEPVNQHLVLEWKRKRSDSSSIISSKK